jgi:hypothetical protein
LRFEETVIVNSLAKDKIDCRNFRYSGSRQRPAGASAGDYDTMVVVVVVVLKVIKQFECRDGRGQSSSEGICLLRWEALGPDILGEWRV